MLNSKPSYGSINSVINNIVQTLGYAVPQDLLWHFPRRYNDFRKQVLVANAKVGEVISVIGTIVSAKRQKSWPPTRSHTLAILEDEKKGKLHLLWFNQGYLADTLPQGKEVIVSGKLQFYKEGLTIVNPQYELFGQELLHTARLVPQYPRLRGIPQRTMRRAISHLLKHSALPLDEIPHPIATHHRLMTLPEAINQIHFPTEDTTLEAARWRLAFGSALTGQLAVLLYQKRLEEFAAPKIKLKTDFLKSLVTQLSFQLTLGQKQALWDIVKDLNEKAPMSRLLQGEVGSGKTIIALLAAAYVVKQGHSCIFLAPTEILAKQHYASATKLASTSSQFAKTKLSLITGSTKPGQVRAPGEAVLAVGTHALLEEKRRPENLGLIIVDEQHRFGVKHRSKLRKPGATVPHLLSLSATPIPRTLALTLYGQLEVSQLKERPSGKSKVTTKLFNTSKRKSAYKVLKDAADQGQQGFVVAPHIEQDEESEIISVKEALAFSKKYFPELKAAVLHGQMKPEQQTEVLEAFRERKYDVLVATSIIEVGVDITNATAMVIESAEYFGLAQLHQLRGRIGRAGQLAYCSVISSKEVPLGPEIERLEMFCATLDGWKLAEIDLRLRGVGSLFGEEQSGSRQSGSEWLDVATLNLAKHAAETWLEMDQSLTNAPKTKLEVEFLSTNLHLE